MSIDEANPPANAFLHELHGKLDRRTRRCDQTSKVPKVKRPNMAEMFTTVTKALSLNFP